MRNKGAIGILLTLSLLLTSSAANAFYAETIYLYGSGPMIKDALEGMKLLMFDTYYRRIFVDIALVSFIFVIFGQALNQMRGWDKTIGYLIGCVVLAGFMFNSTMDVYIEDPVNGFGGTDGLVQDVPVGLALPAVLTSGLGRAMTEAIENYFMTIPFSNYSFPGVGTLSHGNRFNFLAKMVKDRGEYRLLDPVINRNFRAFVDECVVYRLFTGDLTMSGLVHSQDVWSDLRSLDEARLVTYTAVAPPGSVSPGGMGNPEQLITCANAYTKIGSDISAYVPFLLGKSISVWKSTDVASFMDDAIHDSAAWLSQTAQPSGAELVARAAVMNTFWDSTKDVAGQLEDKGLAAQAAMATASQAQTSSWMIAVDVFANSIGYLLTLLQAFIFCCTPIVVLLILIPGAGLKMGGNFLQIMGWFAMIQPMMAIVNYLITANLRIEYASLYTELPTLGSLPAMSEYGAKMMAAGNFMATIVPILAWGMVKTAQMGMTSAIQSATNPKAADKAGMDAASGNMNLDNQSVNNASMNQQTYAGNTVTGPSTSTQNAGVGMADQPANMGGLSPKAGGTSVNPMASYNEGAGRGTTSGRNWQFGDTNTHGDSGTHSLGSSSTFGTSATGAHSISGGKESRVSEGAANDAASQKALSLVRGSGSKVGATQSERQEVGLGATFGLTGAVKAVGRVLGGKKGKGSAGGGGAEIGAAAQASALPAANYTGGGGGSASVGAATAGTLGAAGALLLGSGSAGARASTAIGSGAAMSDLAEIAYRTGAASEQQGQAMTPESAAAAAIISNPDLAQQLLDEGVSTQQLVAGVAGGAAAIAAGATKDQVTAGLVGDQLRQRLKPAELASLGQSVSAGQPMGGSGPAPSGWGEAAQLAAQAGGAPALGRTIGGLGNNATLGGLLSAASNLPAAAAGGGGGGGATAGGRGGLVDGFKDVLSGVANALGVDASIKGANSTAVSSDNDVSRRGQASLQTTDGSRHTNEGSRSESGRENFEWGRRANIDNGAGEQNVSSSVDSRQSTAGNLSTAGTSRSSTEQAMVSYAFPVSMNMAGVEAMSRFGGHTEPRDPMREHGRLQGAALTQANAYAKQAKDEQAGLEEKRVASQDVAEAGFNANKKDAEAQTATMGQTGVGANENAQGGADNQISSVAGDVKRDALTQSIANLMQESSASKAVGDAAEAKQGGFMASTARALGDSNASGIASYEIGNTQAHGGTSGPIKWDYAGGELTFTPSGSPTISTEQGNYSPAGTLDVKTSDGRKFSMPAHAGIGNDDGKGYFIPDQPQSGDIKAELDKTGVVSSDGQVRFNSDQALSAPRGTPEGGVPSARQ